ncbi:MAG: multidrug transporter ATP-binding protein [Actinomycetia bacterium]|jgi:ATP-binding cassette subfamily B protein|nr:multidrug transporter ATP-binding protein [Actinomycetes bacterium]
MGRHGFFRVSPIDEDHRKVDRATVRRVVGTFRPYKGKVGLVGLMIGVTSGLGVINPLMIVAVFDNALFGPNGTCQGQPCPNLPLLYFYVGVMIAVPIVTSIIGIAQTYLTNDVGLNVMQDLRNRLYQHLQAMPLRFFTTTRTGEIQSRLANDVGGVQSVVTDTASTVLSNVVTIVSTIIAMLVISIPLTILSLLLMPLFLWLTVKVGKARREVATNTQRTLADMTTITEETLSVSGILLSKAFGRQRFESERFRTENERLTGFLLRQTMIGRSFFALVGTFFSITPALVYLVAGWVNSNTGANVIEAGMLVGFTTLQSRLFFPIGSMLQVSTEVQSSLALFDRIFEYLDLPHEIHDAPDAVALDDVSGHVRLRDVRFRYEDPPDGVPVSPDGPPLADDDPAPREWTLDGVALDIRPGQLAALVGPSGAGKTTVTYLVPRLYDVQEGSVEIDGLDVRRITLESLGEAIGVVTQETYLFHDTVRRNLQYGKPDATDEELTTAAKAANIHDRIAELPEGYDTVVGERGYKLSGGEKQRLAIARVVLKDPRILILDEATSSLDTTSERLVQSALEPLMKGRTTIAIAHRLSTILSADVIFVLDRGRIVEQGTHEELVERNGLYAQLYEQQFRGGLVEAEFEDGVILASGEVVRTES